MLYALEKNILDKDAIDISTSACFKDLLCWWMTEIELEDDCDCDGGVTESVIDRGG